MKLRLNRNVSGPWGGGYEGETITSPPMPAELASEMIARGFAEEVKEGKGEPAAASLVNEE